MRDPITLIRPDAARPESKGVSTALPPDLLDQVRGREHHATHQPACRLPHRREPKIPVPQHSGR